MLIFVFGIWLNAASIIQLKDDKSWDGDVIGFRIIFARNDYYSSDRTVISVAKPCDEVAKIINEKTKDTTK